MISVVVAAVAAAAAVAGVSKRRKAYARGWMGRAKNGCRKKTEKYVKNNNLRASLKENKGQTILDIATCRCTQYLKTRLSVERGDKL